MEANMIQTDYATGKPGQGESGNMLKLLQKDRRIDRGAKYSPVFGRYAFLDPACSSGSEKNNKNKSISVGDEVRVIKRNKERTLFGMSSWLCFRIGPCLNFACVTVLKVSKKCANMMICADWPGLNTPN